MRTVITCRDVSSAQPLVVNSGNKHTPMFAFPGRKNMLSPTEINVQWEQTVSSWQNDLSVRTRRFLFFLNQVYRVFIILIVLHIFRSELTVVIALLFFIRNLLILCQCLTGQFKKKERVIIIPRFTCFLKDGAACGALPSNCGGFRTATPRSRCL